MIIYLMILKSVSVDQVNLSYNKTKGTIRGLHYQENPKSEAKLIQCLRGSVWDVAVDMRPESASYCTWHAIKLLPIVPILSLS